MLFTGKALALAVFLTDFLFSNFLLPSPTHYTLSESLGMATPSMGAWRVACRVAWRGGVVWACLPL